MPMGGIQMPLVLNAGYKNWKCRSTPSNLGVNKESKKLFDFSLKSNVNSGFRLAGCNIYAFLQLEASWYPRNDSMEFWNKIFEIRKCQDKLDYAVEKIQKFNSITIAYYAGIDVFRKNAYHRFSAVMMVLPLQITVCEPLNGSYKTKVFHSNLLQAFGRHKIWPSRLIKWSHLTSFKVYFWKYF